MKWSDFSPYVMPYVIGCPMPLMEAHVRDAAIEFMQETKCWVRTLDPELTGATADVDLSPDSAMARIFDVHSVKVDGVETEFTVSPDFTFVTIKPIRDAGIGVVSTVAQVLKDDATQLPDEFKHYARHIAHGAIASIKRLPGQPFSSPDDADEMRFRARIRTESARLARGLVVSGSSRQMPSFL